MTSFWGDPTYKPANKEVARAIEQIRTLTLGRTTTATLKIATATLHGIAAFIAAKYGPREALALLHAIRSDIESGSE